MESTRRSFLQGIVAALAATTVGGKLLARAFTDRELERALMDKLHFDTGQNRLLPSAWTEETGFPTLHEEGQFIHKGMVWDYDVLFYYHASRHIWDPNPYQVGFRFSPTPKPLSEAGNFTPINSKNHLARNCMLEEAYYKHPKDFLKEIQALDAAYREASYGA